jgi:D-3-phosphoglycerate dehydrogenase / 2-oxoglutarate reductase
VKALVLDERYGPVLADFDVVREPAADVTTVFTLPGSRVGSALMDELPSLRVIGTASVGFDHIDVDAASERGVAVVSVPDYCTEEVADHTLALLLALTRGVVALDRDVARGGWSAKAAGPLRVLTDLRVGVVGVGRIGSAVARRLLALGVEVWGHDLLPLPVDGVREATLHELLGGCDAVTLHVPLTRETRGLIGRLEIESMRPGALLVNTSRGHVVDDGAVIAALRSGRLGGAALDVLPREPPPVAPLAPNLVVTPHAAYYSPAAEERAFRVCVARVREILGA